MVGATHWWTLNSAFPAASGSSAFTLSGAKQATEHATILNEIPDIQLQYASRGRPQATNVDVIA